MLPYLDSMMDVCDIIIARCKQLSTDPNAAISSSKNLDKYEANVCNNLSRIVIVSLQLTQTKFDKFDPLIKLLMKIFASVDNLAKHFVNRSKKFKKAVEAAKFDLLAKKHVGIELAPKVTDLITFIQEVSWPFFLLISY